MSSTSGLDSADLKKSNRRKLTDQEQQAWTDANGGDQQGVDNALKESGFLDGDSQTNAYMDYGLKDDNGDLSSDKIKAKIDKDGKKGISKEELEAYRTQALSDQKADYDKKQIPAQGLVTEDGRLSEEGRKNFNDRGISNDVLNDPAANFFEKDQDGKVTDKLTKGSQALLSTLTDAEGNINSDMFSGKDGILANSHLGDSPATRLSNAGQTVLTAQSESKNPNSALQMKLWGM